MSIKPYNFVSHVRFCFVCSTFNQSKEGYKHGPIGKKNSELLFIEIILKFDLTKFQIINVYWHVGLYGFVMSRPIWICCPVDSGTGL